MIINNKNNVLKFLLLFAMVGLVSCKNDDFFNEYQSLSDGWKKEEALVFDFESLDTLKKHQTFLNLRTTNEYPYSNIFLIVKLTPPKGDVTIDTLQYQMANADGTMLGSGFTDIKEHKLVWRENIVFNKQGVYKVEVLNAIRKLNEVNGDANLKGITEVGLQVQ